MMIKRLDFLWCATRAMKPGILTQQISNLGINDTKLSYWNALKFVHVLINWLKKLNGVWALDTKRILSSQVFSFQERGVLPGSFCKEKWVPTAQNLYFGVELISLPRSYLDHKLWRPKLATDIITSHFTGNCVPHFLSWTKFQSIFE